MSLASWSVRNPIPTTLLCVMLSIAGLWGFHALSIKNFPDLDFPTVEANLTLPGALPEQLETEVARPVEDSIATVNGIKHISTRISEGTVRITIEFLLGTNLSDAVNDVQDAISKVRTSLPADLEEPVVSKLTITPGGPIATFAVTSTAMDEEALSWFVDDTVSRAVLGVRGVGKFARVGGGTREITVEVDPVRLSARGLTAADVSRALRQVQREASGGRGQLGGAEQGVRTIATVRTAQELATLPIALGDGRYVRLDEVATIRDGLADRTTAALLDGQPSVGFEVSQSKGYDEIDTFEAVKAALAEIERTHPGVRFALASTSVDETLGQYNGSMQMLYEGAILAMLVIWVFLRDWRATIIGALALPLSILPTFAVMELAGFTLNTITLLALTVVVGILVDDAIVEVENINRHMKDGRSVHEATEIAVEEIGLAVIATTFALVAVFLPTAIMTGIPGLVFRQFGWTAVAAVLFSLIVARLVTPMLAARFLRPLPHAEVADGPIMTTYLRAVRWSLAHRRLTLLLAAGFFIGSLLLVPLLKTGFIPAGDRGFTTVGLELPPGTGIGETLRVAEEARRAITDGPQPVPGIARVFTSVGQSRAAGPTGGGAAGEIRRASLRVTFTERGERPAQGEIEKAIRERLDELPGAKVSITSGGPGAQLVILLSSRDGAALEQTAAAVAADVRTLPFVGGISSSASLERPDIVIRPDPARAAERGVTTEAIATVVRIATSGDFAPALSKLNADNRQIDIRVRMPDSARTDLGTIARLQVPGRDGPVPLDAVATLEVASGPLEIDRFDRSRNVSIIADLGGTPLGEAIEAVEQLPSIRNMVPSVQWLRTGDAEVMGELFAAFGGALALATLAVYCVLVLLFKDFFQPVTILSAVPLAAGGAFISVLLSGSELGLPVLIGLVMLLGIVTKNSILLVDYVLIAMREQGIDEQEALVDACHKRARPVLMTSIAMIAGMVPLGLGLGGGDSSFTQPMAWAVIGGLITSTALSLLVVPAVFLYVARFERWVRRGVRRTTRGADAAA
ncbi:MAG: efflux RND transporter permease subunit [Gammaproteobacteria bacterium]|nr:efflux RND transporter permease subunit [Gammaproteobacteria bacterium]